MSDTSSPPPSRAVNRSKNGCISCRIRRVKCDETKPECLRCQAFRRPCDGYLPDGVSMTRRQLADAVRNLSFIGPASEALTRQQQPQVVSPPSLTLSRSSFPSPTASSSSQETMFFDYFRRATAPNTDAFIDSTFWGQDLLQLAHSEPAMWHATLALGALHRRWETPAQNPNREALVRTATQHYGKAMSLAKDLDSPSKVLALSLSLIASANMLSFWKEAHMHILAGFKILAQEGGGTPEAERLALTLTRMEMQSITFHDSNTPYPFAEAASIRSLDQGMTKEDAPFRSYAQASSTLFSLIRQLMLNDETLAVGFIDEETFNSIYVDLVRGTENFERKMEEFESLHPDALQDSASVSIRVYHCWLRFIFRAKIYGFETRHDKHMGYVQRLLSLSHAFTANHGASSPSSSSSSSPGRGSKLQLSLEPAVVAPLFDAGRRCRHPALRRQVIQILRTMNRHEGMWRSDGAAAAVHAILTTEEGDLGQEYDEIAATWANYCAMKEVQEETLSVPWTAWSDPNYEPPCRYSWNGTENRIPEERRVKEVLVVSRFDDGELDLRLLMSSLDPALPFGSVKDMTIRFFG